MGDSHGVAESDATERLNSVGPFMEPPSHLFADPFSGLLLSYTLTYRPPSCGPLT